MAKRAYFPLILVMSLVLALSLTTWAGPAAAQAAKSQAQVLKDSGFKQDVVDTPAEAKHSEKLPEGKLLCYQRDGQKCYAFKDPATNSMFIGDEAAFQRYLDRSIQEKMDNRSRETIWQESDPQFWNMWVDKSGGGG
jgi:hypothetical protein